MIETIQSFLFSTFRISTPIVFVALCSTVSHQAGLTNMAAESMMLTSALAGVIGSAVTGSLFMGLLIGAAASVLITLILCFSAFVMKVDLYLMSISMNLALAGATVYVMFVTTGTKANTAAHFKSLQVPAFHLPIIKDIPVLGKIISGHNGFTYLAWIMVFLVWFLIFKTKFGLRMRAVGQNPHAAESVGINPRKIYTISFMFAGLIASFGGMFLSMGYQSFFIRDMTGGKGFVGMAAATIAGASPLASAVIAYIFGFADAITNYSKLWISDAQFLAALPFIITVALLLIFSALKKKADDNAQRKRRISALERQQLEVAGAAQPGSGAGM